MQRKIYLNLSGDNALAPLPTIGVWQGSAVTLFVGGLPKKCGKVEVTAVNVAIKNADGETQALGATYAGGWWAVTFAASVFAHSGIVKNGVTVSADGRDEMGAAVEGWIFRKGDLEVREADGTIRPGEIVDEMRWYDVAPESPRKGDVAPLDGVIKLYAGERWRAFGGAEVKSVNGKVGDVVLDAHDVDAYTQSETDDKITRFVAHYLTDKVGGRFVPFATHAALADAKAHHSEANPRFFYAGQGFTPTKNDYCVILADETVEGKTTRYSFVGEWPTGSWQYQYTINDTAFSEAQWAAINSGVTEEWMASTLSEATTALNNAEAAQSAAEAAQSAAENAQSAASSASAEASSAFTEAANAYSNSELALSAANDAQNTASEARSTAIEAKDAATSANENANRAAGKADTAQSTANEARSSASYANSRLDSLTTTDIAGLEYALAAKESVCVPSSSVTTITSGSIVDITQASGAVNVTFAAAVGNALRYCELIVRGVTADGGVTINLPSGMDALYAEGVASKAGINHYIFAEYLRGHWLVSRMTRTTTIS